MPKYSGVIAALIVSAVSVIGCTDNNGTGPESTNPEPGTITVTVSGITGQTGKAYTAVAYNYDWQPGATGPAVAGMARIIESDPYAVTAVLDSVNTMQSPISLPGGHYSVVFFISPPNAPPQYYTEVRATVDGNITVTAPKWGSWVKQ